MRAAIMRDHELVVDTLPDPEPGPGQVLAKTLACGICGSDLHVLRHSDRLIEQQQRGGGAALMDFSGDIVMGHEFCAEILDHGPATEKRLKAGTRVCSIPVTFGAGGAATVGYSSRAPGGYGERMLLSEALLLEVPNGLSTAHAALTEPMAVGRHAVEMAKLGKQDLPLVVGCGPVGLAVIAALKIQGVGPILAADFSPRRRELAEQLGADVILDPAKTSPYREWREIAAPDGVDANPAAEVLGLAGPQRPCVIFECVGVPGLLQEIIEGAARGARVVVVGVCLEPDRIEPSLAINKELCLQFAFAYTPEEFAATLHNIAEGRLNVEPMITGTVGVEEIAGAFEELGHPERHAKILAEPWR